MSESANAKPQVLILSDMINRRVLFRYSAPYLLAHGLRSQGYNVKVIDWFTKLPDNGLNTIKELATDELKFVFFCSTFLMTAKQTSEVPKKSNIKDFNERNLDMVSSTMWFEHKDEMLSWFSRLKGALAQKAPDAKIVFGGGASARMMYFIPEVAKYIDLVVSGYGEHAVVELMRNKVTAFENFNDFTYWKVPPNIASLSAYPFVMSREDNFQPEEAGIVELARGCRFRCKFCSYDIGRSAYLCEEELYSVLMHNYDNYGKKFYHFVDNCINESVNKIEVINKVSKRLPFELEWVSFARPEMYSKYPEMIDIMAESGAGGLFYGIETLDHEAGMLCGKGGDKQKFMDLILQFQDRYKDRIYTMGSFIVGLPRESRASVLNSMEWTGTHKPFHFSSFGSLVLQHPDFVKATQHLVFENNGYSMFSTNPDRYGIRFKNRYKFIGEWEHDQMDFNEANQLSKEYTEKAIQNALITQNSSFDYVSFRGAGFSRQEILNCANNGNKEEISYFNRKLDGAAWDSVERYLQQYK